MLSTINSLSIPQQPKDVHIQGSESMLLLPRFKNWMRMLPLRRLLATFASRVVCRLLALKSSYVRSELTVVRLIWCPSSQVIRLASSHVDVFE